ncbi:MAG: thiamine-phosphate kinase [Thermoplasmata archaeon]|nr:thiamine-phosphate kinase [Thermoplasmata archaeon]
MARFGDTDEREMISMIRDCIRAAPSCATDDDAAVLPVGRDDLVVCTDSVTFERHRPEGMSFEHFGWMAAAVNMSDLAAMGATPIGLLSALALPGDLDTKDVCQIMTGIDECAEFCNCHVLGGDTKVGCGLVNVTAFGVMEGRNPMTRKGARVGDVIAVTGELGAAAAGFLALANGFDMPDAVSALCAPIPRVEEGIALSSSGLISSCIDLSDGLATALNTICSMNDCGAIIEWDLLPQSQSVIDVCDRLGIPDRELTIGWGGEYELMFTFDRNDAERLYELGVDFSMIGLITEGDVVLHRDEKYEAIGNGCY